MDEGAITERYGTRPRPSALRVTYVCIPSLQTVLRYHLVTCLQFGYLLALPLLGSCGTFGVWGLSPLPGIRFDIGPLLSGSVKSAEVG